MFSLERWAVDPKLIKLTYNSSLFRVKVDFAPAACLQYPEPPQEILDKAKAKIEAVRAAGQIAYYRLYTERLKELWTKVRQQSASKDAVTMLSVSLAAGTPELVGLKVEKPNQERAICTLSFTAPAKTVQGWRFEWVKLQIRREMEKFGLKGYPCPAMIMGALLRAQAGEQVVGFPLGSIASKERPAGSPADKPWALVWNKQRREVAAIIYDMKPLASKPLANAYLLAVETACQKAIQSAGTPLRVLKNEIVNGLEAALSGPERYDMDLPFVQLVVTGAGAVQVGNQPGKPVAAGTAGRPLTPVVAGAPGGPRPMVRAPIPGRPVQMQAVRPGAPRPVAAKVAFKQQDTGADGVLGDYPGKGTLPITISKDRMQAKVGDFSLATYEKVPDLGDQWLKNEIKRNGVLFGVRDEFLKGLMEAITQKQPLGGMWVAAGEPGVGGKEPYLYSNLKEFAAKDDGEEIDMRSAQNVRIVAKGQLLAEIRYKIAPIGGKDVKGDELKAPPGENFPVTASEGVEVKGVKFYATVDGVPTVDPSGAISLSRSMLHEGDVNLASGNIFFEGPVEITGSVDTGAEVFATGDIVIKGDMNGGRVKANGSIVVAGAVTTGDRGLLKAGGGIQADFIQNSVIDCGGDLVVNKSILSSQVTVGGGIQFTSAESILSGGRIRCGEYINVANMGQPNGNPTEIMVGVDAKIEDKIQRVQKRFEAVSKKNEEDRNNLRELVRKKDAQMTERHNLLKAALQEKVQRGSALVAKLKKHLEETSTKRTFNPEGKIVVSGRAVTNLRLTMAGNPVTVQNDIAGVVILAKKWSGSHFASIEDWIEREKRGGGADKSDKKAS